MFIYAIKRVPIRLYRLKYYFIIQFRIIIIWSILMRYTQYYCFKFKKNIFITCDILTRMNSNKKKTYIDSVCLILYTLSIFLFIVYYHLYVQCSSRRYNNIFVHSLFIIDYCQILTSIDSSILFYFYRNFFIKSNIFF